MNTIRNLFSIILIMIVTLNSCSSSKQLSDQKQIDKSLVGIWEGSETDKQIEGMKKEWIMTRNDNGKFTLEFKTFYEGTTDEFIEEGIWWVEGNKFFEYHKDSDKTDIYIYKVLNKDQIQFEMIKTGAEFEDKNYTFIDTRVTTTTKAKNPIKDGFSIENAIKVKNVAEEYEYVRSNCQGCQILGQSLIEKNGKYYDMLRVLNAESKETFYYFDITSFYGKW